MIVTQKINIKNGYILETKISNLKHIIMIYLTSHDKNDRQIWAFFFIQQQSLNSIIVIIPQKGCKIGWKLKGNNS